MTGQAQWAALCCAAILFAKASCAAVFAVTEPWVRPAGAGAGTEAFMELMASEDATLVDVRCTIASRVTLVTKQHSQKPPFALALTARTPLLMEPGGTRIALARVDRPLKRGERVALTLVIRYADGSTQDIEVDAEVRRRSPSTDHGVK